MILRVVLRNLQRQRRKKAVALLASLLGAAMLTALWTLGLRMTDALSREMGRFGANVLVTSGRRVKDAASLDLAAAFAPALREEDLPRLERLFWWNSLTALCPVLEAPVALRRLDAAGAPETDARVAETVLHGVRFRAPRERPGASPLDVGLEPLATAWRVDGRFPRDAADPPEILLGRELADRLGAVPHSLLGADGPTAAARFVVAGVFESGGDEESRAFASLREAQRLAGRPGEFDELLVRALTTPEDPDPKDPDLMNPEDYERWMCTPYPSSIAREIEEALPGAEATPVLRITRAESAFVRTVRLLVALAACIALGVALVSVLVAMNGTVLVRREEIGLMRALGAGRGGIATQFLLEASAIGVAGGAGGFLLGSGLAVAIAPSALGVPATTIWSLLPFCLLAAVLVVSLGTLAPLVRVLRASPARLLVEP